MGIIRLYKANFSPAATIAQTLRIEYRVASSVGAFILFNAAAPVNADGAFNPVIIIPDLVNGETYTVRITNPCNGSVKVRDFVVGQSCSSYTLQANTGGCTVEWEDCQSGLPLSDFIAGGAQKTICTKTQSGYHFSFGAAIVTSDNGECLN